MNRFLYYLYLVAIVYFSIALYGQVEDPALIVMLILSVFLFTDVRDELAEKALTKSSEEI